MGRRGCPAGRGEGLQHFGHKPGRAPSTRNAACAGARSMASPALQAHWKASGYGVRYVAHSYQKAGAGRCAVHADAQAAVEVKAIEEASAAISAVRSLPPPVAAARQPCSGRRSAAAGSAASPGDEERSPPLAAAVCAKAKGVLGQQRRAKVQRSRRGS